MPDLEALRQAIRLERVGGWLFSSFQHRDPLSESILGIDSTVKNTRPWYYVVCSEGEPIKIVHQIEASVLDALPGETFFYNSRSTLMQVLHNEVLPKARRLACNFSPTLRILSFLDFGTALTLESCGFELVSAATLLQRFRGLLTPSMIDSHNRASDHLYDIVEKAWSFIQTGLTKGGRVYEGEVRDFILKEFESRNLYTYSPPLVAAGKNSSNPHYSPQGRGEPILSEQMVQLDLWAKEQGANGTYADISWVGFSGPTPPPTIRETFQTLITIRDQTVQYIERKIHHQIPVTGQEVDAYCRKLLQEAGLGEAIKHRTGHGIDREVHGSGVNLDSEEFPDDRYLLEGSCFSIEPGIYLEEYGMRTEVNGYIFQGKLHISGRGRQKELLLF
ncbi:MAG: M24 family metallopeptidase [Spirochaetales bacterium]